MCTTGRHIWSPWCCGKTGWECLLFAMVDAVILDYLASAEALAQWHRKYGPREQYWRDVVEREAALLGWWRSCWPLR